METDKKIKPFTVRLDEETDALLVELVERFGLDKAFWARRFIRAGAKEQSKHALLLADNDKHEHTA